LANFKECVNKALDAGIIDAKMADDMNSFDYPAEALSWAEGAIAQKKLQAALDAKAFADLKKDVYSHPKGPFVGYISVLARDKYGMAGTRNVDKMAAARAKRYFSEIPELISTLRTRKLGWQQDTQSMQALVKAVFGETVDDAKMAGEAVKLKALFEKMRVDFNKVGGMISKNEQWNLPQINDGNKIRKAGLDTWKAELKPMLDRELMTDDLGRKLSDEEIDAALDYSYKSITTGGVNKISGIGEKRVVLSKLGKKLANRHSEARFIYFKDADSWLTYQNKYGSGDAYGTITGHIESMAHEIALMERFGSNPNMMHDSFKAMLALEEKQPTSQFMLDWTWNVVSGKIDPAAQPAISRVAQTVRNVITSSTLGSAALSSTFTDPWAAAITANFNGFSGTKVTQQYLKLLNPANEADRNFAATAGFIMDSTVNAFTQTSRFADIEAHSLSGKVTETVMRASGLSAMTDSLQAAFSLSFANHLSDNFSKALTELDPRLQKAFTRYGITQADWDTFRATEILEHEGATFADVTKAGGEKFHEMILSEQGIAVPAPDAFVRAMTTGGLGAGTIPGEAWRMFSSLKSFSLSMVTTHLYRTIYQTTGWDKASYIGKLAIGGAVMGGLTLQLKDIATGKEPRPVDGKYIVASMAQAGGMGIFGDFLFTDQNRFGSSIANTIVGPTGELLDKTLKLTVGNLQEVIAGEDADIAAETVEYVSRYTPKVWWTRPLQNAASEQLQILVDDSANEKFRRIIRKRDKEFNQGYWWKPGEALPE